MRIITEPKVYLVTRPNVDWERVAAFLEDEGAPPVPESIRAATPEGHGIDTGAATVEIAARICYMSYGKGRKDIADFITNLLSSKDGSVFEHVNYGFVFTGISRSLSHELVRHRAGFAYSQRSQRYVDEGSAAFVVPPAIQALGDGVTKKWFERAIEGASSSYEDLAHSLEGELASRPFDSPRDRRKAIRQAARSVLPNATETKMFVTANVRAWRHFIEMRATPFADVEIRRLAIEVLRQLAIEAPLLFGDFTVTPSVDGNGEVVDVVAKPEYSKV